MISQCYSVIIVRSIIQVVYVVTFFDCTADLVGQLNGNGQKGMLQIDAPHRKFLGYKNVFTVSPVTATRAHKYNLGDTLIVAKMLSRKNFFRGACCWQVEHIGRWNSLPASVYFTSSHRFKHSTLKVD